MLRKEGGYDTAVRHETDVRQLQKAGDVKGLLRVLRRTGREHRLAAAQALATMPLDARQTTKVTAAIDKALDQLQAVEAGHPLADPVAIAIYRESLALLKPSAKDEKTLEIRNVWAGTYLDLLDNHLDRHKGRFRLGTDTDRARMSEMEQVAGRTRELSARAARAAASGHTQVTFVIATSQYLGRLVRLVGARALTNAQRHDWEQARALHRAWCDELTAVTGLDIGDDHQRWEALGANLFQMLAEGRLTPEGQPHLGPEQLAAIADRPVKPGTVAHAYLFRDPR